MFLPENISRAISSWKSLVKSLNDGQHDSLQPTAELYAIFRELRVSQNKQTLSVQLVRAALTALSNLRNGSVSVESAFPRTMFTDIPSVWRDHWESQDFENIFEFLKWHGAFEESIALMSYIHQSKLPRDEAPHGDCWTRIIESLIIGPEADADKKARKAWELMQKYETTPTTSTFNILFKALAPFPDSFNFIFKIYTDQMLLSDYPSNQATFCHLLEAHMAQPPSSHIIEAGNRIFEELQRYSAMSSKDSVVWTSISKWMLFRGESLRSIKHRLYEQDAATARLPDSANMSLSPSGNPQFRSLMSSTLHELVQLALRLGQAETANKIYEDFYPAMGVSPDVSTDEIRLEALLQMHNARAAKALYEDLRLEGHQLPSDAVVRLIHELTEADPPLPVEAQAVFFDLLDARQCPSEALSTAFAMVTSVLLRIGDFPRLRQTLLDRNIDRVPNWRNTLSSIALELLSNPKMIWLEQLLPVYHITQRWAAHTITLSHRHNLMHKLISHGRTDLGLELFHDMRHSDISQPTHDTYLIMLSGCAKTRDARTLEHIHNALRLDSSVEPDTSIFNALMLAYNRARLPEKALAIWEVLSQSAKLPDVETASLALHACVSLPRYGLIRAREIWTFMEDNEIHPTSSSYAALLSVFASVGKWDGILGLLERMDRRQVDAMVLGTAFNAMRRDRKPEVEAWAKANRPEVWRYLENLSEKQTWTIA